MTVNPSRTQTIITAGYKSDRAGTVSIPWVIVIAHAHVDQRGNFRHSLARCGYAHAHVGQISDLLLTDNKLFTR